MYSMVCAAPRRSAAANEGLAVTTITRTRYYRAGSTAYETISGWQPQNAVPDNKKETRRERYQVDRARGIAARGLSDDSD